MRQFMYVWVVRRGKERSIWLNFREAWPDFISLWRNNDRAFIYLKFMSVDAYQSLRDFDGW